MRPTEPHVLVLVGLPSVRALDAVGRGLPTRQATDVVCFADFAPATFPVGTTFDVVFAANNLDDAEDAPCRLRAVTQQYGAPWDEVPAGWRTLAVLTFPAGVPRLVGELPEVDSWSQGAARIHLCTMPVLEGLRAARERSPIHPPGTSGRGGGR